MNHNKPEQLFPPVQESAGVRIRLGTRLKTPEPLYWTPEDAPYPAAANLAIVGREHTGNAQMLHSAAIQLLRQKNRMEEPIGLLLFEGQDDYTDSRGNFIELSDARTLRLHKLPFNPLSLAGLEKKPQLHTHMAMVFADTLARAYGLGSLEKSTLVQAIISAYLSRGITSDPLTWDRNAPSLADVYEEYRSRPQGQRSDTLIQILDSLSAMELFDADASGTALLDLIQGTVILDMSGYSEALKHFLPGIALEVLWAQMQGWKRTLDRKLRKMILIDNADRLLSAGSPGLEGLLAQGWEFGLGLMLSAQPMESFQRDLSDCRKWIRAWIVHNVTDLRKSDLEFLLQMDIPDSDLERLYQETRHLRKLHSLIFLGTDEPVLAEDLPFSEIARDTAQSYLVPERAAPEPEPLAGMPLLDFKNLDTLVTLEDEITGPMGIFDDL